MWIRSIWKEIVHFACPSLSNFVQGFEVTRWSRIKCINFRIISVGLHFVHVFDQLIQILEPNSGIGVLEIRTHGHDNVICGIISCLVFGSSDEVPNLGVLIVIMKPKLVMTIVKKLISRNIFSVRVNIIFPHCVHTLDYPLWVHPHKYCQNRIHQEVHTH